MKLLRDLFLLAFSILLCGCASKYKKGGYYFLDKKGHSFYGNDRQKIYILFSDKYVYTKENFNCKEINEKDEKLLTEFNLKPKRLLFSYHSTSGRESIAYLENKDRKNLKFYKKIDKDTSNIYFKTKIIGHAIYRENIYPFRNKYVHIIEKSTTTFSGKKDTSNVNKARIFPLILNKKPRIE